MTIDHLLGTLYAALLGGALGSFANVLILRWHEGASLLRRSTCPSCRAQIRPRHLIPVISWFWLKGRCAQCRQTIHVQYVMVECIAVLLGVIAALRFNPFDFAVAPSFWFEFFTTISLIVPVVMDIRWQELPVEYLAWLGGIGFIYRLSVVHDTGMVVATTVIALAGILLFFGLQIILSRGKWLGMGDVWFGVFMAGVLGWPGIGIAVYVAYVLGGTVAVIALLSKKLTRNARIAFGPMLAAGVLVTLWFGGAIISWLGRIYA